MSSEINRLLSQLALHIETEAQLIAKAGYEGPLSQEDQIKLNQAVLDRFDTQRDIYKLFTALSK